jgi:hypothetical protein
MAWSEVFSAGTADPIGFMSVANRRTYPDVIACPRCGRDWHWRRDWREFESVALVCPVCFDTPAPDPDMTA